MIALSVLLVYALYELFVSGSVVETSRALFRVTAVVLLALLIFSERAEVHVGAGLLFGITALVCIWSFRSEVQGDEHSG